MRNLIKTFSILALLGCYTIDAQQIVKKDTISGTELTMTLDSRVNDAMKVLEAKCTKVAVVNTRDEEEAPARPAKIYVPNRELTNAEVCRKNPRILGFKIQITTVKSNEEANEVKAYFRKRFPNLKVETDATLRPNYRILAGSYFTKQSASGDLSRVKEYFKSAMPVQYRIFCEEAK